MDAIVAVSKSWGIGRDNNLLFSIPEDLAYFREMTTGSTVILGRKTLLTFPGGRPLPKRENIILSTQSGFSADGGVVLSGIEETFSHLQKAKPERVFVIGGAQIYRLLLPYCARAYVTLVDSDPPSDKYFPDLDADPNWTLSSVSKLKKYKDLYFAYAVYSNNDIQDYCERT